MSYSVVYFQRFRSYVEILIRIKDSTTNTVDEDSGHTQVFFEALREVSPGVYVPAEYSFDFQILVRTVDGSAKGM